MGPGGPEHRGGVRGRGARRQEHGRGHRPLGRLLRARAGARARHLSGGRPGRLAPAVEPDRLDLLRLQRVPRVLGARRRVRRGRPGRRLDRARADRRLVLQLVVRLRSSPFAVLVLLLFPDGRLSGRRRRSALWAGSAGRCRSPSRARTAPGPLDDFKEVDNRSGSATSCAGVLALAGDGAHVRGLAGAARSPPSSSTIAPARGLERQQIKWLGVAAVFTGHLRPQPAGGGSGGWLGAW